MPVRSLISVMTGASISISASPWSSPLCRVCAKATTAISVFAFIGLAPLGGSRPRPGAARTSHEVLDLFEGDVGLVDRLEPLDVVHRAAPLLAGAPRRLHPHAHPDLVGRDAGDERQHRQAGP